MKLRSILSSVMAVCMLAGSVMSPLSAAADNTLPDWLLFGDANQDKTVDIADAVLIARFAAEDPDANISADGQICADANGDSYVNADDVTQILRYIAKLRRTVLGTPDDEKIKESEYKAVNLTADAQTVDIASKKTDDKFIDSQYNLTVNLLHEANSDAQGSNMMISPLSISEALAMTANGAKGQTQDEMAKVLGSDIPMNDLNAYYYDYSHNLKNTEYASLKQANSVWVRDSKDMIEVPDTFLQIVKNNYDAQVFLAPFDQSTVTDINNWVNYHTDQMIPKLLNNLSDDAVMCLINALAFDAKWSTPYKEYDVNEGDFTTASGEKVTAQMMNGSEYLYLHDDKATGFIKYYRDGNYSFAAILPNKDVTLDDYIADMTGESLKKLLNSRSNDTVYTMMPKFDFDYSIMLKQSLIKMGMPTAFDADLADFSGLNTKLPTYISQVIHKTHITVDEDGTRAAAVTAVIMEAGCALIEDPKTVYLDRPFLFMILDEHTNLPVFIGTVTDPTK